MLSFVPPMTYPEPVGILVGVRPTKLVHNLLTRFSANHVEYILREVYAVSPEQVELVMNSQMAEAVFPCQSQPACRRVYWNTFLPNAAVCSFASYPIRTHGHLIPQVFLRHCVGKSRPWEGSFAGLALLLESIYFGGGTPDVSRRPVAETIRPVTQVVPF